MNLSKKTMPELKDRLKEIIYLIEKRPSFIFYKNHYNYNDLKYFLYGYLICFDEELKPISLNENFTNWLNTKFKKKTSLLWTEYIYIVLAKEKEKEAVDILIKEFKEFVDLL